MYDVDELIPVFYERDDKVTAFETAFQNVIDNIETDILNLNTLIDPLKIDANFLTILGNHFNAGIVSSDDENTKRIKIAKAVAGHKIRGSFNLDAKPKIDVIAGGDSQILTAIGSGEWMLTGDGNTPSSYYWASLGADGIDDDLGLFLIGAGDEIELPGIIYIDVDNNALTADEQESIKLNMLDVVPAYFKVHFGYIDGSGNFIEYFLME